MAIGIRVDQSNGRNKSFGRSMSNTVTELHVNEEQLWWTWLRPTERREPAIDSLSQRFYSYKLIYIIKVLFIVHSMLKKTVRRCTC
jgi:hypothetical protein